MQSNMGNVTISDLMHSRNHKRAPHHSSVWRYSPGKCFAVPPALSFPRASCVCGSRAALVRWTLSARGVSAGGVGRLMVTSRAGWPGASVCHPRALWAQSDKSVGTGSSWRMRSCTEAHGQKLGISNSNAERVPNSTAVEKQSIVKSNIKLYTIAPILPIYYSTYNTSRTTIKEWLYVVRWYIG